MPQVSSLSENLALDPDDKIAIQRQKIKIGKETVAMQEKIMKYIQDKTENYKQNVGNRMREIDQIRDKILPAISPQEKAAIKEQVKKNVEEAKISISDEERDGFI